ncbi:hypothetical protein FNF28_03090 [Cafeteria roenbergensis]|uniref:WW domain-containing protein n=1 Tax=Cafeteria roenbergensis TaxID=33653 RepID=A0A5A8DMR6_CAFRO|nr:hypothetical protein FNF28_03090 [Cafeteria roenbergensis]
MPAAATDPAVVKLVLDRTYRRLRSDIEQAHGPSPEIMGTIRRSMQALHREAEADLKARERHARWLAGEPGKIAPAVPALEARLADLKTSALKAALRRCGEEAQLARVTEKRDLVNIVAELVRKRGEEAVLGGSDDAAGGSTPGTSAGRPDGSPSVGGGSSRVASPVAPVHRHTDSGRTSRSAGQAAQQPAMAARHASTPSAPAPAPAAASPGRSKSPAHAASGAGGSPEAADEDCTLEPGMLTVEQAWERALDASGAEYFWHTRTRERRWQRPDLRLHIAAEKRRLAHERSVEARRAERAAAEREASAEAAAAESVKAAAKPRVRQWALDAGWQYGKHKPVKGVAPQLALARLLASVHTLPHCVLKALTVDPSSRSSILKAYKRALLTMHVDKLVGRSVAERTVCEAALAEISAAKAAMP